LTSPRDTLLDQPSTEIGIDQASLRPLGCVAQVSICDVRFSRSD
jgi:hypothetical protein